jgi:hypothetical protein
VERALWPMIQGRGDGNGRIATFEDSGPSPVGSVVGGDGSPFDRSVADRVTAANLWQLTPGQDCPIIAGRKVSLIQVDDSVDIEASDKIRARISYVRIGDDRTAVHIKGLTCFVSEAGRRPSSALTLESHATVEFISARGEILGRAEVEFAAEGPSRAVVSVAGESLVVDSKVCRNLIALDFGVDAVGGGGGGPAPTCVLLYEIAAV